MTDEQRPEPAGSPRAGGNGDTIVEELERGLSGAVGIRVQAALEAVQDRTIGSLEGVRSAVTGVEERLTSNLASLQQAMADIPATVRAAVEDAMAPVRDDLEVVRGLPPQVGRALHVVREAVAEIAAAQQALGERVEELRRDAAAIRDEVAERMERVDRLSGVIDSLGRKRGFKDLVAAERRAVEQQEAFVGRLASLGERLVAQAEAVRRRVDEVAQGVALPEDAVARVTEQVTERVAPPLAEQLSRELRGLERATRGTQYELERVRKRMDAWGRARSAPRLAEEIGGLQERVVDLERTLEERPAEEVAEHLERLDARVEALGRLIEEATRGTGGKRRRRFGRRRSEPR